MQDPEWLFSLVSPLQARKLRLYVQELRVFNKKFNLFSRRQGEAFCWHHILDSLLAVRQILQRGPYSLISDIGSGSGFLGVTLAVLSPGQKLELFESQPRKAYFLKYMCWKMELKQATVQARAIQQSSHKISCGVSKAFLKWDQRLKITAPVFKKGSVYYHLQSFQKPQGIPSLSEKQKKHWKVTWNQKYCYLPFLSDRALLETTRL